MNKRSKKEPPQEVGAPAWMASYGDLMTNLLCCFVLLFSMAIVDQQKFEAAASSLRAAFSNKPVTILEGNDSGEHLINLIPDDIASNQPDDASDKEKGKDGDTGEGEAEKITVAEAKEEIEQLIEGMGLNENIKVIEEKNLVIFRVDSLILFDSGKADLKDSGKPIIEQIGLVLNKLTIDILVQGHADDRPISTSIFPSNWELSTKRATNVVKFFMSECDVEGRRLTATGNAEYRPIAPNDSEYNRQKNRRIDIVVAK